MKSVMIDKTLDQPQMRYHAGMLLLMVLFVWWKWRVVSLSLISLALTPIALVSNHSKMSGTLAMDLVPFWLAALTSVLLGVFSVHRLIIGIAYRHRGFTSVISDRQGSASQRIKNLPSYVILACVFIALEAPVLAPFDPLSQGDLRSTRFLNPLEKAVVRETTTSDENGGVQYTHWNDRSLRAANNVLLRHDENYTHWNSATVGTGFSDIRTFLLGTDGLGRDILSRLLYALRISLLIGFAGTLGSVLIGWIVGFISGISGGWVDHLLMRVTDLFLSIPSLFLVIALVAFLGNSMLLLIIVLAGTGWMSVARLVRGELLSLREREFILAARLLGRSQVEIIRDHMFPNVLPTTAVALVLQFSSVILAEAALSFLGVGIQPPTPTLGNMIGESYQRIGSAWWASIFPGLILSIVIVSFNGIAERLQQGRTISD